MKKSIFGDLFDFDGDGEMDEAEQTAELVYLEDLGNEENDAEPDDDLSDEDEDDEDESWNDDEDDEEGDDNWETEDDDSDWED